MLTVYLAALVFGGILVGFSLIGGHHGDASGHDGGHDAGHDPDVNNGEHVGDHALQESADANLPIEAKPTRLRAPLISLRNLAFFSLSLGTTGSLLSLLGIADFASLAYALTVGLVVWTVAWGIHSWLLNSQSGEIGMMTLVGRSARVVVAVGRTHKGRVVLQDSEGSYQITALTAEWSPAESFSPGDTVVIVDQRDAEGLVLVAAEGDLQR